MPATRRKSNRNTAEPSRHKSSSAKAAAGRDVESKSTAQHPPVRAAFLKRNGLGLALALLFVVSLVGQTLAGHRHDNAERVEHGAPVQTLGEYLGSGEFYSTTFENWESEFLQMGVFVLMTVWLYQRGSSESRPLDRREEEEIEKVERKFYDGPAPKAATIGGLRQKLYENSLSLTLFALFALSFVGHLVGSWRDHVAEQAMHGGTPHSLAAHLGDAQFWFESFQNWQSEFLAVFALVVLSIWLRQKESPQSKPVDAPHSATGR
ncbi:MAG TPA: DUF6766 family protein [Candidatus Saccharimonadia bacterium]|nr:DUF6766 family protein [Candidatus Saccharimonadia bacterium]